VIKHRLLLRQLKKSGIQTHHDMTEENFAKLLTLVEQSYTNYEDDKKLYERTSQLASEEFQELNENLNIKLQELEKINKHTQDSIEYASLIQKAILPDTQVLESFCKDYFIYWEPKDIVGGDIYLFNKIDEDSMLLMLIDGEGHGVSGAFLTMLVKAIEEQIFAKIKAKKLQPNPALILEYFNVSIKQMLHKNKDTQSNSGFDGGILYYNKKTHLCRYAGAKTPLYMIKDNTVTQIQSDKKSVGYKRIKHDQKYTEYEMIVQKNTKLYLTTDGILDQENKDKQRFGKERFKKLLLNNHHLPFSRQYHLLKENFKKFKGEHIQNDDITAIGLSF